MPLYILLYTIYTFLGTGTPAAREKNARAAEELFYSSTYQFSALMHNEYAFCYNSNHGYSKPNISFEIERKFAILIYGIVFPSLGSVSPPKIAVPIQLANEYLC